MIIDVVQFFSFYVEHSHSNVNQNEDLISNAALNHFLILLLQFDLMN